MLTDTIAPRMRVVKALLWRVMRSLDYPVSRVHDITRPLYLSLIDGNGEVRIDDNSVPARLVTIFSPNENEFVLVTPNHQPTTHAKPQDVVRAAIAHLNDGRVVASLTDHGFPPTE
jgi:hypothetical protein